MWCIHLQQAISFLLPGGRWDAANFAESWEAVTKLGVAAGFIPHDLQGRPEESRGFASVPQVHYKDFRLMALPQAKMSRRKLLTEWGLLHRWPEKKAKKRKFLANEFKGRKRSKR